MTVDKCHEFGKMLYKNEIVAFVSMQVNPGEENPAFPAGCSGYFANGQLQQIIYNPYLTSQFPCGGEMLDIFTGAPVGHFECICLSS